MRRIKVFERDVRKFTNNLTKYILVPHEDIRPGEQILLDSGEGLYIVTPSYVDTIGTLSNVACSILTVSDFEMVV